VPDIQFIAGGELEIRADRMWTGTAPGLADPPASGVAGAHGKVYDVGTWDSVRFDFSASQAVTGRARWRFRTDFDNQPFWLFNDSDAGLTQVRLVYRSTGAIEAISGSDVLATSATGLFVPDTWYELECRTKISNGAGVIAVNRNGSQIICVPSGADTQQSANPYVNSWVLANDELDSYWDDAVLDRSGAYLGTGEVETLMPNGVGDLSQLTPDSIAANYSRVSEKPHDSDTSYVFSTGDQIDTYAFENRSLSGTPMAVMLSVAARHTALSPTLKLVCRIDGDNYESDAFSTHITYQEHFNHCWTVNPATGEEWTDDDINNAQFGVHCLNAGIRVTQVGLQVYVKSGESDQCLLAGNKNYCLSVDNDFN
jgi:hypothetical protein